MNNQLKIGITGSSGFIGSSLIRYFQIIDEIVVIPFNKIFFSNDNLVDFIESCDVIIHLAGVNRSEDPNLLYKKNIELAKILAESNSKAKSKAHIIYSSSTQEELDNLYGKSKKIAGSILENSCKLNNVSFVKLIIPNVFGPFSKPFYNTVVATFCFQYVNNIPTIIKNDSLIGLIYIDELILYFLKSIKKISKNKLNFRQSIKVKHTKSIKVSNLEKMIKSIFNDYITSGIVPDVKNNFKRNLFITLLSFFNFDKFYPYKLKKHSDSRGAFSEVIRSNSLGQFSFSTTKPKVERGHHFHTRKIERFCVVSGRAEIMFRRIDSDKIYKFVVDGDSPSIVDMPVWHTHMIKNISKNDDLLTLFWISEHYNEKDPDTYLKKV